MSRLINIGFLSIIFFFCISFLMGGGAEDMFTIEKRELSQLPSLENYTLEEMPRAYTEYISDHFPLRRTIMKAAAVTSYKLFGNIRSDAVVIGENRFLFLNTMDNTSPKADYQGTNLFSEEQMQKLVNDAVALKKAAEDRGQQVVLMIVPNKEEVYSKYLPDSYNRINEITRRQQFVSKMTDTGITVVDMTDELKLASSKEDDLYFLADTHWTGKGAYIGASVLLDALGINHIPYSENSFEKAEYYESDIANLCHLYDEYTDTRDYSAEKNICSEKSDKSIMFMGDSFRWRIEEYLDESFEKVTVRANPASQEQIKETDADILVIQVVERNLMGMLTLIPNAIY